MNPNIDTTTPPVISPVFIDKVYATLPIDITNESHIKQVKAAFNNIKEYEGFKTSKKNDYEMTLCGNNNTYGKDGDMLLQYGPSTDPKKVKDLNYLRFAFNPAKNCMESFRKLINTIVPGGYGHFIDNAKLNRIDYTVDIHGVSPNDLLMSSPRMGVRKVISKAGKPEYLLMGTEPTQIVVYDKCGHLKHLNKKIKAELHHQIPDHAVTRIEIRHVRHVKYGFNGVHLQPNPFEKLTLMIYPDSCCKKGVDPPWHMFIKHCRREGIERTLDTYFNKDTAIKWKQRLFDDGYTAWFDPDKVWGGIANAVDAIINPPNTLGPFTNIKIGAEPHDWINE